MNSGRFILRGMITAGEPPTATNEEAVEFLVLLDDDAAQTANDELAKVRRLYEIEVRKRGREIIWFRPVEALLKRHIEPNQLLFTLPGVEVYELPQMALIVAGSVVTRDVPDHAVVAGNPVKPFR
ncbi:MAG: hypothetical protein QM790_03020 [Nibricoccus sp.]